MEKPEKNQLNSNDPDSIFLFGNDIQAKINGFTKTVSEIILYGHGETDYVLMDMKNQIDSFEEVLKKSTGGWQSFIFGGRNLSSNYSMVLSNINKLEVALKLQEARLLKDITVFKKIIPLMKNVQVELDSLIQYGQQKLKESMFVQDDIEKQMWSDRLEKRLNDLEISHTVLMQTQKQIELLMTNDIYLVDKILTTIETTIPIWRTQLTLLLGIEEINEQTVLQNKITEITEKQIKGNAMILKRNLHKAKSKKDIDVESIKKLNESFIKEMDSLSETENKNSQIIANTRQIVLQDGVGR